MQHIALRTERETVARGWARLRAATAVSAAAADFAEGAEIKKNMETYVIDLQQQVHRVDTPLLSGNRGLTRSQACTLESICEEGGNRQGKFTEIFRTNKIALV